jgi:Sigma-70 region 3
MSDRPSPSSSRPSLTPTAQVILDVLLEESISAEVVSLDRVAEAIGAAAVTMQDIEAILDALEAGGRRVESRPEFRDPPAALAQVLKAVRSFSAVSGRRPTLPEIAQHSGLSVGEVRFALLYARVLVR